MTNENTIRLSIFNNTRQRVENVNFEAVNLGSLCEFVKKHFINFEKNNIPIETRKVMCDILNDINEMRNKKTHKRPERDLQKVKNIADSVYKIVKMLVCACLN